MNSKGYSIIEILIVIAIGALLAGGLFTAYNFIAKENVSRVLVAKSESDVESMLYQVVKDIQTAGFGIEKYKEQNEQKIEGTLICGSCQQTDDVGLVVGNRLAFYSLASREARYSGCWAVIKDDNKLDIEDSCPNLENTNNDNYYLGKLRKNFFWQPCHLKAGDDVGGEEIKMKANYYYNIMTRERVKREVSGLCMDGLCQCGYGENIQCDSSYKRDKREQLFAFFATEETDYRYPEDFRVVYSLDIDTQQNRLCAINEDGKIYSLYKRVSTHPQQPIINCVLKDSLRFRAGILSGSTIQYTENIGIIKEAIRNSKLRSVKICMIIQIGGRQDIISQQKPQFNSLDCGSNPSISDSWWNQTGRYYRWKVIEKDIPLYNFQ
ncbi:MAG: prepilin-type N-terminal cleavage/methylation domain-containing protein [Thermodesulfovibrio sp.]|nr:prepilin-type N-terminal cleavage/methylation domain-containing protein [Thermodesulfovibrio sp.]